MRVLHLSDTQLSGSPYRISSLLSKYGGVESKHFVWQEKIFYREFPVDLSKKNTTLDEIRYLIYEWADVIVYHNRWRRQEVFKALGTAPPNKPSVIQIHSPREGENFREEVKSGLPIACFAQYHPRQWPECKFILPNVVDIYDSSYIRETFPSNPIPIVSYAPSNTNRIDWNNKSYGVVAPILKKLKLKGAIKFQLLQQLPFEKIMPEKKLSDIGIDEISCSYHLSSLEYLSLGIPCFAYIDSSIEKVVKDITGAEELPWIRATEGTFERLLGKMLKEKNWAGRGKRSREWMERYWNPLFLCDQYLNVYRSL